MCKILTGSWGTLAAMTEITIKVLPKPETEATVLVTGLTDADALLHEDVRQVLLAPCDEDDE